MKLSEIDKFSNGSFKKQKHPVRAFSITIGM